MVAGSFVQKKTYSIGMNIMTQKPLTVDWRENSRTKLLICSQAQNMTSVGSNLVCKPPALFQYPLSIEHPESSSTSQIQEIGTRTFNTIMSIYEHFNCSLR